MKADFKKTGALGGLITIFLVALDDRYADKAAVLLLLINVRFDNVPLTTGKC